MENYMHLSVAFSNCHTGWTVYIPVVLKYSRISVAIELIRLLPISSIVISIEVNAGADKTHLLFHI